MIVDCFYPLLGRSPFAKKRGEEKLKFQQEANEIAFAKEVKKEKAKGKKKRE